MGDGPSEIAIKMNDSENTIRKRILSNARSRKMAFKSTYVLPGDDPPDLVAILGLEKNHLSDIATETLDILENESEIFPDWNILKKKVSAFLTLQDVFDGTLFPPDNDQKLIFHQWYFYYEAKYILTEWVLLGLNGFSVGSASIARLFIEFCMLQNYYFRETRKHRSFAPLLNFFKKGIVPSWNSQLKYGIPSDKFCKPIRKKIDLHFKGLSANSLHPYHPSLSAKQSRTQLPEQTVFDIAVFVGLLEMILETILWVFYVNFPMLFFPVDLPKKFGFNYLTGLFVDLHEGENIKRSLTEEDYQLFRAYAKRSEEYESWFHYYDSRESMSEDQILSTWSHPDIPRPESILQGHVVLRAEMRAIMEAASLDILGDVGLATGVEKIHPGVELGAWKKIYKDY